MAKNKPKIKSKISDTTAPAAGVKPRAVQTVPFQVPGWAVYLFIFFFSCIIYSNTLWNDFALDDAMVFTSNKFTKEGLNGVKEHFITDIMEGVLGDEGARMVTGGRYRPLSLVSYSLEYELMRRLRGDKRGQITDKNVIIGEDDPYLNPALSHAINVLLFALSCVLLYYLLEQLIAGPGGPLSFTSSRPFSTLLSGVPFIATLLYAAHPIHTEAVANIKGRDEVMCMLFSLLALLGAVNYAKTGKIVPLMLGLLAYFLAMFSKENAITFYAVIPLTFFFFTHAKPKQYAITLSLYLVPVVIFLVARSHFTQSAVMENSPDIQVNPFVYASWAQRYATPVAVFLYYFKLLIFPFPLSSDYYYNQIPYVNFTDGLFIISVLVNAGLLIYALLNFKKKTIPAYAILFYFITFSLVSNILFSVSMLMNERLIYMSSLGFCLLLAWLMVKYLKSTRSIALGLALILAVYTVKTYSRNQDWKNNFSLFSCDVCSSPNSARAHFTFAAELIAKSNKLFTVADQKPLLDSAIVQLNEGLEICPAGSATPWLMLADAMFKRSSKAEEIVSLYSKAVSVFTDALANPASDRYWDYLNIGKIYHSCSPSQAPAFLLKADSLKPGQSNCKFMLAEGYAQMNQPDQVEYWLKQVAKLRPLQGSDYHQIGFAFGKVGKNLDKAAEYMKKAIELEPQNQTHYQNLGEIYGMSGKYDEAIAVTEKLLKMNPKYTIAYQTLSTLYNLKGNKDLAVQYMKKFNQLAAEQKGR